MELVEEEIMDMEKRNSRNKPYLRFRTIFDMGMGVLYIVCGIFILMAKKLGVTFFQEDTSIYFFYLVGGLIILYGLFRIYRGFKRIF